MQVGLTSLAGVGSLSFSVTGERLAIFRASGRSRVFRQLSGLGFSASLISDISTSGCATAATGASQREGLL